MLVRFLGNTLITKVFRIGFQGFEGSLLWECYLSYSNALAPEQWLSKGYRSAFGVIGLPACFEWASAWSDCGP
jgi:hypothetical protein